MRAVAVIPTLNACELLSAAVASLEAQTVPVEVVVVDNASSDGSREMLAARYPHQRKYLPATRRADGSMHGY